MQDTKVNKILSLENTKSFQSTEWYIEFRFLHNLIQMLSMKGNVFKNNGYEQRNLKIIYIKDHFFTKSLASTTPSV